MKHLTKLIPIALVALLPLATPALAKKDIDWDKRLAKGYYQMSIGNYAEAVKMFGNEVDKHPESGAARTALGMALKRQGKMGEAKASLRRATEVEPGFAEGYYELGAMLENDKEYPEALKCFERYLQLAPLSSKKQSVEDRVRFCKQKS